MILDFNNYKNKKINNLTEEDIFNLLLIFKYEEPCFINIEEAMKSLGKYSNIEKYSILYEKLNIKTDENNGLIADLMDTYNKMLEQNVLIETSTKEFMIIASEEYINKLKERYHKKVLQLFNDLMYFINNDLRYGIDNWELVFEDEIIEIPGYPSIVTGEFVDQEKDDEVIQQVKQRSIERLKNNYNS